MKTDTSTARRRGPEVRSIDYIPLAERHGKVWHLGPLWFMTNAQIVTLAVGVLGVSAGGNLIWSLVAIIAGTVVGTLFVAMHSAQGPQMGLPQMIQSRPQFGYVGAILVWLFAYLQYAGYNVFNTLLAGDALHATAGGNARVWVIAGTAIALMTAIFGYKAIHRMEQGLTYGFLILFGILTVVLFTLPYPAGSFDFGNFGFTPFLLQFSVVAGYQITWAVYVSDYSRYLPPTVTVRRTFWWTYGGSGVGAVWIMCIGAALSASAGNAFDTISSLKAAGDRVFHGFGAMILIYSAIGLVSITALNLYGGSLTLIGAIDSFKRLKANLTTRVVTIGVTALVSLVFALTSTSAFLDHFSNFLLLCLYFFIPWTAINLVDYYLVRRGHYAILEIFKPAGIYHRWGWRGIVSYLVGFVAMIPFFSTGLFTGWVASAAHGADFSLFVGLPVAGGLYYLLSRNIDVENEAALAREQAALLESEPAPEHDGELRDSLAST